MPRKKAAQVPQIAPKNSVNPDQVTGMEEALAPYQNEIEEICPPSAIAVTNGNRKLRQQDKYTRDNVLVFLRAIALGFKQKAAAPLIHCSAEEISRWKQRHPDFAESVEKARSINKMMLLNYVYQGMSKHPRLALDLLERVHPDDYAPQKNLVQSGSITHAHGHAIFDKLHQARRAVDSQSPVLDAQVVDNQQEDA